MNHAETRELLLDLAYGELPAHVEAEVSEHVAGCAECRAERAEIESVRKAFAPIREEEQPSPGFDERILAASRAEAQLTHDGNIGEVVEVTARETAPSIEPGNVDAHAQVVARKEPRRPKWMKPAAAVASVAAAAALAVVVGTSTTRPPALSANHDYQIRVGLQAEEKSEAKQEAAKSADEERRAQPTSFARDERTAEAAPPPKPVPKAAQRVAAAKKKELEEGSGGDLPSADELNRRARHDDVGQAAPAAEAAPPPAVAQSPAAPALKPQAVAANRQAPAAAASGVASDKADAPQLELRAGSARRSGNYALAAGLYRQAALGRASDESSAAWDLAHAVECLAAAGSFDEARKVRDELAQSYASQTGALSAAGRALREVDSASPNRP
jgi:anti-sigma factor RsiW